MSNQSEMEKYFFRASAEDFKKIPGSPIAYWVSEKVREIFEKSPKLGDVVDARQGLATADNDRFLRLWYEVPNDHIGFGMSNREEAKNSGKKWFPYNKGGEFRKWYGNQEYVINWENDGEELWKFRPKSVIRNPSYYFKPSVSWSDVTSSDNAFRYYPKGFIHDVTGHSVFNLSEHLKNILLSFCNNKFTSSIIKIINPTMHFHIGYFNILPFPSKLINIGCEHVQNLINNARNDWDSYETSWDFTTLPLLRPEHHKPTLKETYAALRQHWQEMTLEMKRLEEENNRIFIEAYGLEDELTPDVPLNEITLTCNPHYRYPDKKNKKYTDEEREAMLLTDTIKELISYAIGCMMGRYSLDEPGLIYAHSGNEDFEPDRYKTFPADEDGIIPITDIAWFPDDATNRFVEFMKTAWTEEHLDENLEFVAEALKPKRNEQPVDTIRRYLSTSFYKDHLKTYKKLPIYWLFSSGKQRAFQCLVYLHRYNEATLSRMRSAYVIPLQGKLNARIEYLKNEIKAAGTAAAKNKLRRELEILKKKQAELTSFDDELRHYADKKICLDLDDGVKVNYGKFGSLLAEVKEVCGKKN